MPNHTHDMDEYSYGGGGYKNKLGIRQDGGGSNHLVPKMVATNSFSQYKPLPTGGSQTHNNIQPSITVYFWKRVA